MTLYELIKKIGEGTAPQKMELFNEKFTYNETDRDYYDEDGNSLFADYYWQESLETEINNICYVVNGGNFTFSYPQNHKISKLIVNDGRLASETTGNYCYTLRQIDKILIKKINELVDEVILLQNEEKE